MGRIRASSGWPGSPALARVVTTVAIMEDGARLRDLLQRGLTDAGSTVVLSVGTGKELLGAGRRRARDCWWQTSSAGRRRARRGREVPGRGRANGVVDV